MIDDKSAAFLRSRVALGDTDAEMAADLLNRAVNEVPVIPEEHGEPPGAPIYIKVEWDENVGQPFISTYTKQ